MVDTRHNGSRASGKTRNVVWAPQEKQEVFMRRPEYEALYGGAAGGGKSDALVNEALRQVDNCDYRAIIFRKTFPQLSDLIDRSMQIYKLAYPRARYNGSNHCWTFPSGAKIYFGSMQHTKDRLNYQGKHFDFIGFDELTHFTWEEYSYMFSRNRPSKSPKGTKKTRVYIRATTNPGGIGHGWVKNRFIDAAEPLTPITEQAEIITPEGETKIITRDRVFVPATVFDNKILLEEDPSYLGSLALLPEKERNALLYGEWDTFTGQYFTEFRDHPDMKAARDHGCDLPADELLRQHRWTHVIEPFDMDTADTRWWNVYRSYDFGYDKPFSVGWYAVSPDGTIYRIMEWYGCTKTPNTGIHWDQYQQAKEVARIENTHPWLKGKRIQGVADPAIFKGSVPVSAAFTKERIYFTEGNNERLPGLMQCHYRLQFDDNGRSRFYVFKNCKDFIRTIPLMMYDEKKYEDIDSDLEDHICDEWRYFCMSRPVNPLKPTEKPKLISDPLDMFKQR